MGTGVCVGGGGGGGGGDERVCWLLNVPATC